MKKLFAILLALTMVLGLAACGGSSRNDAKTESSNAAFDYAMDDSNGFGWAADSKDVPMEEPAMEEPAMGESSLGNISTSVSTAPNPANTKIIYSADMELETKSFDEATRTLDGIVKSLGGWYESRSLNQGGTYRRLNCVVRVPAENFIALLDQAGSVAHVTYRNEYSDDISEAYYDNEARLATQRTKLERLQKLLAEAASMEDIIDLEYAISDTELQIEYLTGALRKNDSLVNYSTVSINLREVYRLSTDEAPAPLTFSQRLSSAFSTGLERGIDALEDLAVSMARNWMTLLILAVVVVGAGAVIRHKFRKKRRNSPPASASNTDNEPKS